MKTVNDVLRHAEEAEAVGVPINWKQLCYTVYQASAQQIQELEQARDKLMADMDPNIYDDAGE